MSSFRHVLVATDLEEHSARAIEFGLGVAARLKAEFTLVHACEFLVHSSQGLYPGADVLERLSNATREQLDTALADARRVVPNAQCRLRGGSPWQQILSAIEEVHADLVVLGTHGKSRLERFVLGSVAERVVRLSPVPTIVVP